MNRYLKGNLKSIVILQVLYSLFVSYLYIPLVKFMFEKTITLTKVFALTPDSLKDYFLSFYTIVFILVVLLSFVWLLIFEISMIMNMITAVEDIKILTVKELFVNSLPKYNKTLFSFKPLYILYIIISFFVFGTLYVNPYLTILDLPTFMASELYTNSTLLTISLILFIISLTIVFLLLYVFVIMANEKITFKEACKRSIAYVLNNPINALISLGVVIILYLVQSVSFSLVDGALYFIASRELSWFWTLTLSSIISVIAQIIIPVISILARVLFFRYLTYNYFEECDIFDIDYKRFKPTKKPILRTVIVIVGIITVMFIRVGYEANLPYNEDVDVIAHRGESLFHIENSLEAIQESIDQEIKMIEIDVVLTKDNEVIVYHDLNLERLTGDTRDVSDVTLEEIKALTITKNGLTSTIPSLQEVLDIIPSDVSLLIELKPDENNYEQLAIETEYLISNNSQHLIQSFSIDSLETIKAINPNRSCGFILIIGAGGFVNYNFADFYTIEESYISRSLVTQIHVANKEVYVWTINESEKLTKSISLNVDGIITDKARYFKDNLDVSEHYVFYYRLQELLLIDIKFINYENLFVDYDDFEV